ncbi:MAG: hypothetical protein AABW83_00715 [Nanoarchaeota archaeon]
MLERKFGLGLEFELPKNKIVELSLIRLGDIILNRGRRETLVKLNEKNISTIEINETYANYRTYKINQDDFIYFEDNPFVTMISKNTNFLKKIIKKITRIYSK